MDTLKYYEQLVSGGSTELEAKAHVYALNECLDSLVTKDDLRKELDVLRKEMHAEFKVMKTLGWALFVAAIAPNLKYLLEVLK